MANLHDSMIEPPIEDLVSQMGSKFALCSVAATRAREINAYFGQLGAGVGTMVPPQVDSVAHKPLSIAFEEIAAEKILSEAIDPDAQEEVQAENTNRDGDDE